MIFAKLVKAYREVFIIVKLFVILCVKLIVVIKARFKVIVVWPQKKTKQTKNYKEKSTAKDNVIVINIKSKLKN